MAPRKKFQLEPLVGTPAGGKLGASFVIQVTIGDGVNVVPTGYAGDLTIGDSGYIYDWDLIADNSGSIVIDSWKKATHPPAVGDTMWGAKPTLASAIAATGGGGLAITVVKGHRMRFNIDSAATVKQVTLTFFCVRT